MKELPPAPEFSFGNVSIIDLPEGGIITDVPSLDALLPFFVEAEAEISAHSWRPNSVKDFNKAIVDVRGGFNGNLTVESLELIAHGTVTDGIKGRQLRNAWKFAIDMTLSPTAQKTMHVRGGLVVGNADRRLSVRAYDLERHTFGKVSYPEVNEYISKSKTRGAQSMGGIAMKKAARGDTTRSTT